MPNDPSGPWPPPNFAHDMRDHLAVVQNALELIRLVAGEHREVARALASAERGLAGLGALADQVNRPGGEPPVVKHS